MPKEFLFFGESEDLWLLFISKYLELMTYSLSLIIHN
jgi:hypothetical protein